jgi:DNA-binding response OmpR family regulator
MAPSGCGRVRRRLLIVEDESPLVRGLSHTFRANGFDVVAAADGPSGLEAARSEKPDLILLDVMLPKMNGYEVCRAIRSEDAETPILMLTAKTQEQDIILGLNLGADDYITKPFRTGELIARIKALLRRRAPAGPLFLFGDFELDVAAGRLTRAGREIALTSREFRLLAHFATRPGRALSRDSILNAVWGNLAFVTERSIDRYVATLRAKIEPHPHKPIYIRTIRDIGYRFEPD